MTKDGQPAADTADDQNGLASAHGTLGMALIARYVRYANAGPASFLPVEFAERVLGELLDEARNSYA